MNGDGFTTKEIVIEVRDAVTELARKLDRIDRTGSIGTKAQLEDHEARIRKSEAQITVLQDTQIKREEVHAVRDDISAIRLILAKAPDQLEQFRALQTTVSELSGWRWRMVGAYLLLGFMLPVLTAISWQLWG